MRYRRQRQYSCRLQWGTRRRRPYRTYLGVNEAGGTGWRWQRRRHGECRRRGIWGTRIGCGDGSTAVVARGVGGGWCYARVAAVAYSMSGMEHLLLSRSLRRGKNPFVFLGRSFPFR
jgi:hypothetical protein